jgi:hypothetical protein
MRTSIKLIIAAIIAFTYLVNYLAYVYIINAPGYFENLQIFQQTYQTIII